MIDAAGEPDAFQIDLQSPEFIGIMRDGQVTIDHLQHLTDTEIILTKLVEGDVSSK